MHRALSDLHFSLRLKHVENQALGGSHPVLNLQLHRPVLLSARCNQAQDVHFSFADPVGDLRLGFQDVG